MATDGVKIIDGDRAHDTYNGILDLYDAGVKGETILVKYPLDGNSYDAFDREVYVTSRALALWEVGLLPVADLNEVKRVIEFGEGERVWTAEVDGQTGKARARELETLWSRISHPNLKTRKRKQYKKVTQLLFNPNDLLALRLTDGRYGAVLCVDVHQHRGECSYVLGLTTYRHINTPNENSVLSEHLLYVKIGMGGLATTRVLHTDMLTCLGSISRIGVFHLAEEFRKEGMIGYTTPMQDFDRFYQDLDGFILSFGLARIPFSEMRQNRTTS
jgi:hypothetical protein